MHQRADVAAGFGHPVEDWTLLFEIDDRRFGANIDGVRLRRVARGGEGGARGPLAAEPVDRKMKAATAASPFGRRTDP